MAIDSRTERPTRSAGRLERRKARTRAAILDAATRLFTEVGYHETSMQDVARIADVGVGTLYGYFESKEDLFRAVLTTRWREAVNAHREKARTGDPPVEQVVAAIRAMAGYIRTDRRLLETAFAVRHAPTKDDEVFAGQVLSELSRLIERGQASGEIGTCPPGSTAGVLVSSASLAMLHMGPWAGRDDDETILGELEQITRKLLSP